MRTWPPVIVAIAVVAGMVWSTDTFTLQGQRTVYTVDCRKGVWQGKRCSGQLVNADRFRFQALKAHREVLFWRVGVAEPTDRFADCNIVDGRNWSCRPESNASRTITLEMVHGQPLPDTGGRAWTFHAVAKWRWWMLRWGLPAGNEANE